MSIQVRVSADDVTDSSRTSTLETGPRAKVQVHSYIGQLSHQVTATA